MDALQLAGVYVRLVLGNGNSDGCARAPRVTWTRLRSPSCTCLSLCPSLFSWWVSSDHCQSEQNKQKLPSSSKETSIIFTNMMGAKPTVNGSSTTRIGPTRKEQCAVLKRINKIIKHFLWWHQMSNSQKKIMEQQRHVHTKKGVVPKKSMFVLFYKFYIYITCASFQFFPPVVSVPNSREERASLTRFSIHHIACSWPYLSLARHPHQGWTSFLLLPELHHCWEQLWHQDAVDPIQRTMAWTYFCGFSGINPVIIATFKSNLIRRRKKLINASAMQEP